MEASDHLSALNPHALSSAHRPSESLWEMKDIALRGSSSLCSHHRTPPHILKPKRILPIQAPVFLQHRLSSFGQCCSTSCFRNV
jgi:hypothetical protein